ncbi:MAG: hypothetical protein KDN20_26550 [Verrucomicrobiae bacterium]|nr:hypothetical protein [Verrucomicrobiae bacterium]
MNTTSPRRRALPHLKATIPTSPTRLIFATVLLAGTLSAQDHETPPTLNAADLLDTPWLKSDLHVVESEVITESGLDRFIVRTAAGVEVVHGNELVRKRIREIHAAAALDQKTLAGAAVKGVVNEGIDSAKTLGGALKKPVRTVFNIPKGIASIAQRSAGSVENKTKSGGNYTGGPLKDWFQVSEAKLELAAKLGVDPYTDYEPLAKELSRQSGTSAVSGICLRLLVPGDGIIGAAEAGEQARHLNDVYATAPSQLFQENLRMLGELGVSKDRATQFLSSPIYSPADQSLIVRTLSTVGKPDGVTELLDAAEQVENRDQGFLFRRSMEWLHHHHQSGQALVAWVNFAGYPAAIATDRQLVVPVYADHLYWTQTAAGAVEALATARQQSGTQSTALLTPAVVSPRLGKELASRGVQVIPTPRP